ncbi:putative cytochrome P450 oxidoreductase [Paraphoma chrysanthemicola]|uniref:Cytochrome P450 oxidoreductase n=1 Tax=Paraphoma chrysanthemicola TaxID=798071 RepID=A0A8K0QWQ0_9PLEO|nr:putative cytochrome P450 oxidoreductase [Paraphoma chrysanthemicola]
MYNVLLIGALAAIVLTVRVLQIGKRDQRLPPGPPTTPIFGNALQLPPTGMYKVWRDWAAQYGSVFSLKIGPSTLIVLCDRKAIHKLLVEQGAKYSSRKQHYITNLITGGVAISMSEDNRNWREQRKVISHALSPKQLDEKHYKVQEAEATVLMNNLLNDPANFYQEIRRYTSSVITSLVFGYRSDTYDTFWCREPYENLERFAHLMEPGAVPPVDEFPFLQYIPSFLAPWKRRAAAVKDEQFGYWTQARSRLEKRRLDGTRRNCIGDMLLDEWEKSGWPMSSEAFTWVLGEFVAAGSDTTASQLQTLILALAKNPHVQKKAQVEIDAVCGSTRAPTWSDLSQLPYINAIVKEGMRWRPVAVTGLPHAAKEDGFYEDMLIPKDSMIFVPVWALHHTEELYKDHDAFNPDRYLDHPKLANDYAGSPDFDNRDHYGYGAGRRICPGIHLAERNMWRIIAKLIWAFDFKEPQDPKTGEVIPIDQDAYTTGHLVAPRPFSVQIIQRSKAHISIIKEEQAEALAFLEQYN